MDWDLDHQVLLDACVHGRFESETKGNIWHTQAVFMFPEAVSGLLNIDPASRDHFGARGSVCCCLHRASDGRADAARRPRRTLISARLQVLSPRTASTETASQHLAEKVPDLAVQPPGVPFAMAECIYAAGETWTAPHPFGFDFTFSLTGLLRVVVHLPTLFRLLSLFSLTLLSFTKHALFVSTLHIYFPGRRARTLGSGPRPRGDAPHPFRPAQGLPRPPQSCDSRGVDDSSRA